ncbi:MAG: acyloxyacyl hydrolase [Nitrospira sp.]|nr:acyloxyacyl hydrolase [Nitrospira sp.]
MTDLSRSYTVAVLICLNLSWLSPVFAEEPSTRMTGNQTVGMVVGGMLPVRLTDEQSSKLNGVAVHPSWQIALTDPSGSGWWSGSIALGAELAVLGITQPTGAYGIGFTPKVVYTLASFGRLKPYFEAGGGPIWTNFDGRIPEQGSDFNFLVWAGGGAIYDLTTRWALNVGVRFSHISNAGTDSPNGGVNYLLPFAGVTAKLF